MEIKENSSYLPLFETKKTKGRIFAYLAYASSIVIGLCLIFFYRVVHLPEEAGVERWAWIGLFMSELWFSLYWLATQSVRLNPVYRSTFKHRLSQRYENVMPKVDAFVCTADHTVEPPLMVVNTVLSVMAYDYPTEKLCVYLSDDGGSELMFYALLEASRFSKYWLPYCKKFKIEPRSPATYFSTVVIPETLDDPAMAEASSSVKLRVSSRISNGSIILTVDCDMYSNNSESLRDALCFLMDEEKGHRIAFVQFPQSFDNLSKNDLYNSSLREIFEVELPGVDANGGPLYIGTGCFHRRASLCGNEYEKDYKIDWRVESDTKIEESTNVLEETCRILADCSYEDNTEWGKEMGLKYGCPVEDVITGLLIKCRGWRTVYYNPERKGFLGVAPTTLLQSLVQHKRWSEGHLQILLSKYCPLVYGRGKIPLLLQMSYICYQLWAPNCLATLFYVVVPSLCIHRGISLFPKLSSPWVLPFLYVILANNGYSFGEFLLCGGTVQEWWNEQRMWLFRRTTSYLFAFIETIFKLLGFAKSGFAITAKVADEDVSLRYKKEVMEFGAPSPMFNILATISVINLFSFVRALKMAVMDSKQLRVLDLLALQILLCGLVVLINLPVYGGLFFRKDKGRMPTTITYQSVTIAILAHLVAVY